MTDRLREPQNMRDYEYKSSIMTCEAYASDGHAYPVTIVYGEDSMGCYIESLELTKGVKFTDLRYDVETQTGKTFENWHEFIHTIVLEKHQNFDGEYYAAVRNPSRFGDHIGRGSNPQEAIENYLKERKNYLKSDIKYNWV